jgi:Ca2+-transporting ATPase
MFKIVFRGIMIGLCTLGCFTTAMRTGADLSVSRTCALLTLIASQLIHVFECKSETGNIFTVPYLNNGKLVLAVLFSAVITILAICFPPLQNIFSTSFLSGNEILMSLGFAFAIPVVNCIFYHEKG